MSDEEATTGRVAIGISFGNAYSSIAYTTPVYRFLGAQGVLVPLTNAQEGKAEVIANEEGDRQIPSILSYVDGEEFQGTQAKAQLIRNPRNTIAYFRDFLGQDFKSIDPTPAHQSAHPREHKGTIAFSIRDPEAEEEHDVTVSEITTRHLRRLKDSASDFLGRTINACVITVPTNFSEAQKQALGVAAKNARLEVLQFINEPTAALLAYDARPGTSLADKIVVVADIGATRSDVAVIASRGGIYTILATAHDYDIGGSQLDQLLMDHFAKEFLKKNKSAEDPRQNQRSLAKLKLESEAVKKALSLSTTASFGVESLSSGVDFTASINRSRFELLATKQFASITLLITNAIAKADLDPLDISEIILAGGTAHTPRIATNVQNAFAEGTTVWAPSTKADAIDPSELTARGAAIQASLISEFEEQDIQESCHPVVTNTPHLEHAVGVLLISSDEHGQGVFKPLVEAHTPVPVRRTAVIATPKDGGDVLVKICEADSHIKVEKKERPKTNGENKDNDEDDEDQDEEDSEEDDEEVRSKAWKVGKTIAEAAVKGVKKGGKVEVQINIAPDLAMNIIAREVGGRGGVRAQVDAPQVVENGSA
jgi:molecular chaperone DnaK (HSP70)